MCAINDLVALRRLRQRKKPIKAWKVLMLSGRNMLAWPQCIYGPGVVKAKRVTRATKYDSDHPRGLHAYWRKARAQDYLHDRRRIVPVFIDPADLIAVEFIGAFGSQLVACRLIIRPEDWNAAGLPKRATRRRYA